MTSTPAASSSLAREYRKGNWTIQETLILITAKKMDDERRVKTSSSPDPSSSTIRPSPGQCRAGGELRWKWVENYCWEQGCHRSQNQCNDKWDNLLRDYKKVREYQSKSDAGSGDPSYWQLEKHERKDRNLPSNMAFEIYQALNEVVQRRYLQRGHLVGPPAPAPVVPPPLPIAFRPPPPLPAPSDQPVAGPGHVPPAVSEGSDTSETDSEDKADSTKRRKFRKIGSSIVRSASILARALRSSEEKNDRRHQEVMEIERRRLEVEEARNEVNRQGIAGLVAAVTNLSGAIESLVSGGTGHP